MKKRIIQWSGLLLLFLFIFGLTQNVAAATLYKNGKSIKTGTTTIGWLDGDKDLYSFKYDGSSVYFWYVEINLKDKSDYGSDDAIKLSLVNSNAEWYEEDELDFIELGDGTYGFIHVGDEDLIYGETYKFRIYNNDDVDYKISYRIEKYNSYSTNIKMTSRMNMKIGDTKKINVSTLSPYGSFPGTDWKSSNSKIAEVDNWGNVTAKKKGNCIISLNLYNGRKVKCNVSVSNPPAYINYYKCTMYRFDTEKLKIMYTTGKVKWTSSNKKIATVSSNGTVKAIGIGKCKITGTVGKKKYYCNIQVNRQNPDFGAVLSEYNTRDNYFVVRFQNKSNKPITICTGGIKAEQESYRVYDRNLSLPNNKTITIPAKKSKTIRLRVKGRLTWYNKNTFTIIYYFIFDGKKYEGHVWNCDSVYKKNGKWYNTYWTIHDEWYRSWY